MKWSSKHIKAISLVWKTVPWPKLRCKRIDSSLYLRWVVNHNATCNAFWREQRNVGIGHSGLEAYQPHDEAPPWTNNHHKPELYISYNYNHHKLVIKYHNQNKSYTLGYTLGYSIKPSFGSPEFLSKISQMFGYHHHLSAMGCYPQLVMIVKLHRPIHCPKLTETGLLEASLELSIWHHIAACPTPTLHGLPGIARCYRCHQRPNQTSNLGINMD